MIDTRSGTLKLFRFAGIKVFLHWTWFAGAVLLLPRYVHYPVTWPVAIATYITLFAIVLLHEFGHSLACRQVGGQTHDIVLWPLGGIAYVSPPPRPGAVLWSIAAGPLVNVALIPVLYGLAHGSAALGFIDQFPALGVYWDRVRTINLGLLIFNVIPVYPLDGGQILQSLLWFAFGRVRSLQVAAVIGLIGVAGFGVLALWIGDYWLGFVARFLGQRCWVGLREARMMSVLQKLPRHTGYVCPTCHTAPPGGPLWVCGVCRNRFDPFSTNAVCPHCMKPQERTVCPHCGTAHPIAAWRAGTEPPIIDV
jgi:Zn-dependent protease